MTCIFCGEHAEGTELCGGEHKDICITCTNWKHRFNQGRLGTEGDFKVGDKVYAEDYKDLWLPARIYSIQKLITPKGNMFHYLCQYEHHYCYDDDKEIVEDFGWIENIKPRTEKAVLVDDDVGHAMYETDKPRTFGKFTERKCSSDYWNWFSDKEEEVKQSSLFIAQPKKDVGDIVIDEEFVLTTPLRELRKVIFQEDSEGNRYRERIIAIIKSIGFSDWALMNNLPTNPEAIYMNRYSKSKFRLDEETSYRTSSGSTQYGSWKEYIDHHFYYTWENSLPIDIWDSDNYDEDKERPQQSTLFSTEVSEKVSPNDEDDDEEELTQEDDEVDKDEEEELEVAEPKQQSTLFGGVSTKGNDTKLKQLNAELDELNAFYWIKREFDIIAEVDSGKIYDNNEADGLGREFEIGSAGFEELGLTEEYFKTLSYEQYVKVCMEQQIKFNEDELGYDTKAIKEMAYDSLEQQIKDKEEEIKTEKDKKVQKCNQKQEVQIAVHNNQSKLGGW